MSITAKIKALVVCPVITFYLFDLYTHNPFIDMEPRIQVLNMVFYQLTAVLLVGFFGCVRTALMVQSCLFMMIGLANYYVLKFRSAPIVPWDIFSISTAAGVADNFDYGLKLRAVLVLVGFVILLVLESRIRAGAVFPVKFPVRFTERFSGKQGQVRRGVRNLGFRVFMVVAAAILLHGYVKLVQNDNFIVKFGLYNKLFTPAAISRRDGNAVAFLMELEYLQVERPKGYSAEETGALYEEMRSPEPAAAPESVRRPNIIVIMDEAFSDLSVLGEFETNEDYMPFIRSLTQEEDTISGYLNVSVLGGNTSNTEFEFLTGHSMAFLPRGSVAYLQYLNKDTKSLPSYLKELGYFTVAIHPYNESGWERDRVYPLLGFDEFLALSDFAGAERIRKYVSDEACFERIIALYEEKEEGQPLFVFNVTMQNHGGYDQEYADFTPDIEVAGAESAALNRYLSLIRRTDEAFEGLVKYFAGQEEDTMIVFFGDHQPTTYVSDPIIRLNGLQTDSLSFEQNLLKYKVPYIIWSNFEMPGAVEGTAGTQEAGAAAGAQEVGAAAGAQEVGAAVGAVQETSVNYLAVDVLENCGLPLPEYFAFLKEFREEYPIVTAVQIQDARSRLLTENKESQEQQDRAQEGLLPYQRMQYYMLFDLPVE